MRLRIGGALLVLLMVLLPAAAVWAQGNTGAISGRVTDTTKQPIPGASVTVTSKYVQGSKGTATNIDGEFMIPYLPPGNDYQITVEGAGFNKVVQGNIIISLGSTTTLDIELMAGDTVINVTSRPPVVTLKETKVQTNLTQEELEMLPISREYQDTLYLAPTVVTSGMGGNPGVAGSTGTENIFLINGLNTTDPVTGTFGTNLNYNFIREIEVSTGGLEAEFGASTGGLFNVLTKSGTNEYHGEIYAYYVNQELTANANSTDIALAQNQPYHNYDYGFDVGGPIIKDTLWFFAGYNPSLFTTHNEGAAVVRYIRHYTPPSGQDLYGKEFEFPYKYDDLWRAWLWSAKLNWRVSDKHNLELAVFGDPTHLWYNEGMFPYTDKMSLMTRRYQGGFNAALKWYATWTSKFFMETGVGQTHSILQITPWDHEGFGIPLIASLNFSTAIGLNAGSGTIYYDDRYNTQYDVKATYLLGHHEIKFGANYEGLKWDDYSGYTGGAQFSVVLNKPGTDPLSPFLHDYKAYYKVYLQNPKSNEKGDYTAAFVQDKWSITDYVNLSAGVRWEKNALKPKAASGFSLDSWSPRLGLSWDFAKNGKSKFFLNWGQYFQRIPLSLTSSMDPGHATYEDVVQNGHPTTYAFNTTPTSFLGGTDNQYNEEYLVGAEYEVLPDFTLGVRAQFRSLGTVLEDVGYIADNSGTIDYIVMNPGTNQWPSIMDRWANWVPGYEKFPRPIRNYMGFTLTANKRYSNHWFLNANYTWSQLKGNFEGAGGGYGLGQLNPNATSLYDVPSYYNIHNYYGLLQQDRTHQLKVQGSYKFDMGLVLGANFELSSGRPMNKFMDWPRNEVGYGTVLLAPRGSAGRMPTTWTMDLHAEYAFKIWKSDLALFADIFNVTNNQAQTAYVSTYYFTPFQWSDYFSGNVLRDPYWGKTAARQTSRNMRMGIKWSF